MDYAQEKKKREKWIQWLILGRNWSDRFDSVFVISNISFFAGGGRFSCPSLSEDNSKDYTLFLINKDNKHRSKHMQPQWKKRGVNYLIFLRGANKCLRRFSFKWYFFFLKPGYFNKGSDPRLIDSNQYTRVNPVKISFPIFLMWYLIEYYVEGGGYMFVK